MTQEEAALALTHWAVLSSAKKDDSQQRPKEKPRPNRNRLQSPWQDRFQATQHQFLNCTWAIGGTSPSSLVTIL
jgi:hypothetical protein